MNDRLVTIVISSAVSAVITLALTHERETQAREVPGDLEVDRLIVRGELIVSDTGKPWEEGFEAHQIPRGIYARPADGDAPGGLWVRSRLIKGELDDPFDDRFHALERNGDVRRSPGHISWNAWIDGNWRQMAIIQGEGLEPSESPAETWSGGNHPGRFRVQSYRPYHDEPLTDALIGQGKMSLGGGGFGGGGLPLPQDTLSLWGGELKANPMAAPQAPSVIEAAQDGDSGPHEYAIIAVGAQGEKTAASPAVKAKGRARLRWDSAPGADAYVIVRDGQEITEPIRMEGSVKEWSDKTPSPK